MANSTMSSLEGQDLTKVTGPAIVGVILNWYLYGILTVQYILYLMYSRGDKIVWKLIVHLIFLLDTVQTFITVNDTFFYFVYGFDNVPRLFQFRLCYDVPTFDAIIGLIVQGVYYWRIWRLSGWRIIPICSAVISLVAAAGGMAVGIQFQRSDKAILSLPSEWANILWLFSSAVADIIIAGSMMYILLRWKKETSTMTANSTIGGRIVRLLILTLETNSLTAAVAIVVCITFFIPSLSPPTTNFYQLGGFLLGKLYSNCFMVLLNQRYHGTNTSVTSSTVGVPQAEFQTEALSTFNADMGTGSGRTNSLIRPVRLPLQHNAQGLTNCASDDSHSDMALPEIKYEESGFGEKGPQAV